MKKAVRKTLEFNKRLEKLFEFGVVKDLGPSEKLVGGLGDGKDIEQFNPVQVVKGIKVEMEHTNDVKSVCEIVVDHLTEDPLYYDKLEQVENG
jgi:hypothetical protein